ncbi:MAG: AtpZ/AtpI family protein [Clostridiales bacterium]|jgi:ATP synthase protein I|nr:AtpZ/AtpI family protein [Clostridiales bacterium]
MGDGGGGRPSENAKPGGGSGGQPAGAKAGGGGRPPKSAMGRDALHALGLLSQLGISMAACVLIGVLAGSKLDGWLGTSPWLLVLFAFIGAGAAFKVMYDIAIKRWSRGGKGGSGGRGGG